jgi:hypothetical protein
MVDPSAFFVIVYCGKNSTIEEEISLKISASVLAVPKGFEPVRKLKF